MTINYSPQPSEGVASRRGEVRRETVIRPPSFKRFDLAGSLARLAEYRDLLYTLSLHRVKVRYKQTALGLAWAVLQPLSIMLLFTLLFSLIVKMPSEDMPYAVFAYTG